MFQEILKKCQNRSSMLLIQMRYVSSMVLIPLRMYEIFLGPIEQAKPWNTSGISGVHNF